MTFAGGALFVPTVPRSSAPFDLRSGSGSWHETTGFIALDLSLYLSQALGKVKLIRDGGTQAPRINSTVTDRRNHVTGSRGHPGTEWWPAVA